MPFIFLLDKRCSANKHFSLQDVIIVKAPLEPIGTEKINNTGALPVRFVSGLFRKGAGVVSTHEPVGDFL